MIYHRIYFFCDNAAFHKSRVVQRWVTGWDGRVVLHYLPRRTPEELVFWRLHEAITRNHRHQTINELVRRQRIGWKWEAWADRRPRQ